MKKTATQNLKMFNPDTQIPETMNCNIINSELRTALPSLLPAMGKSNSLRYCSNLIVGFFMMAALFGMKLNANAQISYTSSGSNYTQNFDNLYTTVPANNATQAATILPSGWQFVEAGANANTTLRNDNGSSGTGDTYLDGATSSNERAFGSYASGSLTSQFGASFLNNSGTTLTEFTLSYTGEQWKDGGSATAILNKLTFAYAINPTSLTVGTYTNVTSLDFTALINNTTADATTDGNAANRRTAITFKVTGISWQVGQNLYIRWTDVNDAGNDDNLAIDDLTFSAAGAAPTNPSGSGTASPSTVAGGGTSLLTVSVTPGTNPASTGITVTGDLSSIGGSATQTFFDNGTNGDAVASDNVFSYNATVAVSTTEGAKNFPITIADAQSRSGSTSISLTLTNPSVNLSVNTNSASETGPTNVTVTATASSAVVGNRTVDLAVTGTNIDGNDYTLINTTITIPSGQTSGSVTFAVVDDNAVEGSETAILTISNPSAGIKLGATTTQNIAITDNDAAGITVTPTSGLVTTEAGGTASFTVVLNTQPTSNVTVGITSSNTAEGTVSTSSLSFTYATWNIPQTVTITGVDDFADDGDIAYSIITAAASSTDVNYNSLDAANAGVTNTDNDAAGITVTPISGLVTTEAGGTANFTIVLNSQPTANVTIGITSSNTAEGTVSASSFTFTNANWNVAQTLTITGVDDAIVDGNIAYSIVTAAASSSDVNYNTLNAADVSVTNNDNDAPVIGATPVLGDIIFNEYASDDDANGNDFFELLVLTDGLDLRGLRVSDNELTNSTGTLNNNETVFIFGTQSYLSNVPKGTRIVVYSTATGVTTDITPVDLTLVLAPGTGVTTSVDGLGGSSSPGLATGGDALYLYLPGPDGNSSGTDNIYLDYISWEVDGAVAPAGLVDINLASLADNAYFSANARATDNDLVANWVRYDFTGTSGGANTTPATINPNQSLALLNGTPAPHYLSFNRVDTTVVEGVGTGRVYMTVNSAGNAAGSVDLSASTYSTATANTDYTFVATSLPATLVSGQLVSFDFNINNDGDAESDEYVICKFGTLSNAIVSGSSTITQSTLYIQDNDKTAPIANNAISLNFVTSYSNGASGTNSAEISTYDSASKRIYIANSVANKLDIVNFANPAAPVLISSINLGVAPFNGAINSVDVYNGTVALALEGLTDKQANGKVVFTDINGTYISEAAAGAMPDMITFNHAGTKVYTANEGEPNTAYTNDPVGSITVVDISGGVASPSATNILFTAYNGQETTLRSQGIRIYGVKQPGSVPSNASEDFEPEYITVSDDDSKAWVTLQENNALVELNLTNNTIVKLIPLGFKDHSNVNNPMDVSDQTFGINLSNFNVKGMYEPDAIAHYTAGSNIYLLTANEGDSRAYTGFSEETRVSALTLDPTAYPNSADIKNNAVLGRLTVTNKLGDTDNDGDIDQIYSLGGRSFSIWDPAAVTPLVYDSKDDMERITSTSPTYSQYFNMSNTIANTAVKNRSDDKGPEPEGVTVGKIGGKTYAFVGIERIGGVFVYDITNPLSPAYVTYANSRTIAGGDRGAEGIVFIPASQSPSGKNLVILSNEISSTLSVFEIAACDATNTFSGTGDWTDGSKWSCLAPPLTNTNVEVIIAPGANATLNTDFIVAGSLQLNATSNLTINANQTLSISGTANFNGQSVTLRSNATGTASLGQITGTLNGASNVTVERYLPFNNASGRSGKAWRLLTAPVTGTTVNAAWQQGMVYNGTSHYVTGSVNATSPTSGYGTLITGGVYASSASANAQGFDWWDAIKNATSSIRTHNGLGTGAWLTPANTTSLNFVNNQGYLLYVRGDRSISTSGVGATTLRATGTLKQGGFTPAIIPNGISTFTLIGNPYASPINFETIYQNNSTKILPRFTIFDANLGLSGGYYLVERDNATSYNITPKPSGSAVSSATAQFIQSSQAIFVEASTNNANTLSIAETDKATGGNASVFLQNGGGGTDQSVAKGRTSAVSLNINLNIKNADNSILLADGAVVRISAAYNKSVTSEDATKTNNIAENLAIGVDNYNLISERRPTLGKTDTVFLKLWGTSIKNYQLDISGTNLKGRTASLIDSYLGTATPLNLDGSSNIINFSISSDAASKAINRFYIVTPGSAVTALRTGTLNEQSATTNKGAVSIKAYPNPATGKMVSVLISNLAKGSYTLSAFSSKGQQLFTRTIQHTGGDLTQDIALNNWTAGVYSLQLMDANGAIVKTTSIIVGQ